MLLNTLIFIKEVRNDNKEVDKVEGLGFGSELLMKKPDELIFAVFRLFA